jgi:hypothetical protein
VISWWRQWWKMLPWLALTHATVENLSENDDTSILVLRTTCSFSDLYYSFY